MPREILADDIERFLATVEGVASVRLSTSASGEIDHIYVTADDAADGRATRRSVAAALMTTYGIAVEPWRIQVTHLRGSRAAEVPDLEIVRVEETVSGTEATALVQVAWERAGERRTGTGQARGPLGTAHRLRTLAIATIDAARGVLDPAHRRLTFHQAALATCMDLPVVLVGISGPSSRATEIFIGAAPQRESAPQAAVNAALDAVTKWILHAAAGHADPVSEGDRRAHLEAMRHFARSGVKTQPGPTAEPPPGDLPPPPPEAADVVEDLQEIRPEQKGGAAMTAHEASPAGVAPPRAGRQTIEDAFYLPLIEARTPVHIRCLDGYEVAHAVLRDVGTYTLLVDSGGGTELLYKHAIISIRPLAPSPGA